MADTTFFGNREVPTEDKVGLVGDVFSSVAQDYDRMNDAMSLGVHRLWKSTLVKKINPRHGERFLDVAGGTGDIAFRIQDKLAKRGARGDITVLDINAEMLAEGRRRSEEEERNGLIWLEGNAEALELPTSSFDAYSIAFGIRNVTNIDAALREAYRVLQPGGRFYCLEFSAPILPAFDPLYRAYSNKVIPWLGARIAGDRASYEYLVESIQRFPPKTKFAAMMEAAGFGNVGYTTLSTGIVAIHSGWKL